MLTTYGEPPAWDAFSKVNANKLTEDDYLSDDELEAIRQKKETALVKAKPMSINGWDPETKTQAIFDDLVGNIGENPLQQLLSSLDGRPLRVGTVRASRCTPAFTNVLGRHIHRSGQRA